MSENKKKTVYFQDKNPYNPYNFRVTNKKTRTILGLQIKKFVQSVHFGHPAFELLFCLFVFFLVHFNYKYVHLNYF